jgi:hypothetical protein
MGNIPRQQTQKGHGMRKTKAEGLEGIIMGKNRE